MKRAAVLWICITVQAAFGQPAPTSQRFEAADVHPSPSSILPPVVRVLPVRNGRYEVKNAAMVDLIRVAYGYDTDKIVGGPSWLEMDRFDVIAKVPGDAGAEELKSMLQALLAERFHLTLHKGTQPMPAYALTAGKKVQLKPAAGTEEAGCKVDSTTAQGGGTIRMGEAVAASMGLPATLNLGPGGTIRFNCRGITMAAFADKLHGIAGAAVGNNPVVDETGLEGKWNFDFNWTYLTLNRPGEDAPERITIFDALEKQLGLKLEPRQAPTPVLIVDSADEKPIPNPPETAKFLPAIPPPTEFEVASVKPAEPGPGVGGLQSQAGGRLTAKSMPMRMLLLRAFNVLTSEELAGLPAWVDAEKFDIMAKAPAADATAPPLDVETLAPLMRALLRDRFKMTYHLEDRPIAAYTLLAGKPKLKKADPTSRAYCKFPNSPGTPPGSRLMVCQNVTMAQFAERLQRLTPELTLPVADGTGIEGAWDFSLTFNPTAGSASAGRGGMDGAPGAAQASAPSGAYSIFEAIDKQLGLKLDKQKRPMPVVVIDHLEQRPTEN